jgi:hypothetical protein
MPYTSVEERFPKGASYIEEFSKVDPFGEIGGDAHLTNGNIEAVIWSSTGAPTILKGGSDVSVYAINYKGEAVGYDDGEGVLWTSETSQPLILGGQPLAINSLGESTGYIGFGAESSRMER